MELRKVSLPADKALRLLVNELSASLLMMKNDTYFINYIESISNEKDSKKVVANLLQIEISDINTVKKLLTVFTKKFVQNDKEDVPVTFYHFDPTDLSDDQETIDRLNGICLTIWDKFENSAMVINTTMDTGLISTAE